MEKRKILIDDDQDDVKLRINEDYSKNYEYRKQKEELNNLKNKLGSDVDEESSTSEEEDENGIYLDLETSGKIMEAISMIKSGDARIYEPERSFFEEEDEQEKEVDHVNKKKKKALTIRDYRWKKLTGELKDESDEEDVTKIEQNVDEGSFQDRKALRDAFHEVDTDEEEDTLFKKRDKGKDEIDKEDEEYKHFLLEKMAKGQGLTIDAYRTSIGSTIQTPEDDFLLNYVLNRGWVEKDANKSTKLSDDGSNYSDAESFEQKYNFRFEEPGSNEIVTHARNIDGLVRRPDERRISKRKKKLEKKNAEISKRSEEIKRYKSLKKKEILNRLKLVQKYTDVPLQKLENINFEEEFDADKFDQQMATVFNDEYYAQKTELSEEDNPDENPPTYSAKPSKRVKKFKVEQLSKYSFKKAIDELANLSYEDYVGDQATRFKYIDTIPTSYNLTTEDIINTDDRILNRIVSIKKLAPYRDPQKTLAEEKKLAKKVLYMKKKKFNTLRL